MLGITVAMGFIGMVLAPCAVGLYSKWGEFPEIGSETPRPPVDVPEATSAIVGTGAAQQFFAPHAPLSTSTIIRPTGPAPVPSLREVAERAGTRAREAQAAAAQAHADSLSEVSRAATRRADAASRLAEAAELELARAGRALSIAEANKARARQKRPGGNSRDYLPHDHPSLDFPRSPVAPHRAA